jgi:hypothetical protein
VLGINPAECDTSPQDAARVIDELLVLCELDPNVTACAADGCNLLVNRARSIAHTYCARHRHLRAGGKRIAPVSADEAAARRIDQMIAADRAAQAAEWWMA